MTKPRGSEEKKNGEKACCSGWLFVFFLYRFWTFHFAMMGSAHKVQLCSQQSTLFRSCAKDFPNCMAASYIWERHVDGAGLVRLERGGEVLHRCAFVQDPGWEHGVGHPTFHVYAQQVPMILRGGHIWVCDEIAHDVIAHGLDIGCTVPCPGTLVVQWLKYCKYQKPHIRMLSLVCPRVVVPDSVLRIPLEVLPEAVFYVPNMVAPVEKHFSGGGGVSPTKLGATDCLMWDPRDDDLDFVLDGHVHTAVTPALTRCVMHNIIGECRNGVCVLRIGPVHLACMLTWSFRPRPWSAMRRTFLSGVHRCGEAAPWQ